MFPIQLVFRTSSRFSEFRTFSQRIITFLKLKKNTFMLKFFKSNNKGIMNDAVLVFLLLEPKHLLSARG